jgi:hypothetical protein
MVRCSPEAKVIRLEAHAAPGRLVQEDSQPDRARAAFPEAAQQKILGHAAFKHCIHNQNVTSFQLGMRAKQDLAARVTALMHIPHVCANKVADDRGADVADQIGRENKPTIQGHEHIQPAASTFARNLFSQRCNSGCNARGGKCRPFPSTQRCSSAITIPFRVLSSAAKSAATRKPRAQTRTPPLVNTGQPSRSQRLMRFSFNKHFSLWAFW